MYAIYEPNGRQLSLFEPEDEAEFFDLNEAEEILRKLQKENPNEYDRITNLPHGIRTAKNSLQKGLYVFCEACDPNRPHLKGYQQLFLIDQKGDIISRDIPHILATLKADSDHPADSLPKDYNSAVIKVKSHFAQEVKHRQAEREYQQRLTQGQRYIIRELRILFKITSEEDLKTQINILEKVFRSPLTQTINRELNILRRNSITQEDLLKQLILIYNQHQMREWLNDRRLSSLSHPIPQIICSEALT